MPETGKGADLLTGRLQGVADRIAAHPEQTEDANTVREAVARLQEHEAALTKARKEGREEVREALLEIQGTCQEVAHEVEDPIQAVNEIEALTRKTLSSLTKEGDSHGG